MLVIIEDRHSSEEIPNICEIIYSEKVSRKKVPRLSVHLLKKTAHFIYADDFPAKHVRKPICCSEVVGCVNSMSTFAIINDGGNSLEEDEKQFFKQSLK